MRSLTDNEASIIDREREIDKILAKERVRKGYGMRGDGATDSEGKKPIILKFEKLFNQYEHRKSKLRDMQLFKIG